MINILFLCSRCLFFEWTLCTNSLSHWLTDVKCSEDKYFSASLSVFYVPSWRRTVFSIFYLCVEPNHKKQILFWFIYLISDFLKWYSIIILQSSHLVILFDYKNNTKDKKENKTGKAKIFLEMKISHYVFIFSYFVIFVKLKLIFISFSFEKVTNFISF